MVGPVLTDGHCWAHENTPGGEGLAFPQRLRNNGDVEVINHEFAILSYFPLRYFVELVGWLE